MAAVRAVLLVVESLIYGPAGWFAGLGGDDEGGDDDWDPFSST